MPYSFTHAVSDSIPTFTLPDLNIDSVISVDISMEDSITPRFAFPYFTELNIFNSGVVDIFEGGSELWRIRILSAGAYSLGFIFDLFYLEAGSELFLYNDSHSIIRGAYSFENNKIDSLFSIFPVSGDACTLELYLPNGVVSQLFELSVITHDFKNQYGIIREYGDSGECQVNVNCQGNKEW